MELELTDDTKRKIGILFKFERMQMNLTQKAFIEYNGVLLCSLATYSKIENGFIIKSDEVYEEIAELHGLTIHYSLDLNQLIENNIRIKKAIEDFDFDTSKNEALLCLNYLEPFKNGIIAKAFIRLYQDIIAHYTDRFDISIEHFEQYFDLYEIYDDLLKDIVIDIQFRYANMNLNSLEKMEQVDRTYNLKNASWILLRMNYAILMFGEGNGIDATYGLAELERHFKEQGNYNRLLDILELKVFLYINNQKANSIQYFNELVAFFEENKDKIIPRKQVEHCYNLALKYIDYYDYENAYKAIDAFIQSDIFMNYHLTIRLTCLILITYVSEKLHKEVDLRYLNIDLGEENCIKNQQYTLFDYYRKKKLEKWDVNELEKYMMNEVIPAIDEKNELMYRIINDEVEYLIKITKNYKIKQKIKYNQLFDNFVNN